MNHIPYFHSMTESSFIAVPLRRTITSQIVLSFLWFFYYVQVCFQELRRKQNFLQQSKTYQCLTLSTTLTNLCQQPPSLLLSYQITPHSPLPSIPPFTKRDKEGRTGRKLSQLLQCMLKAFLHAFLLHNCPSVQMLWNAPPLDFCFPGAFLKTPGVYLHSHSPPSVPCLLWICLGFLLFSLKEAPPNIIFIFFFPWVQKLITAHSN